MSTLLGELLANQVIQHWYGHTALPEVVIPIPLHPKRLRHRGYNQSYELLRGLKKRGVIPVENRLCWRVKHTKPQSTLDKAARYVNMQAVFACADALAEYQHVAIMDDVVTTGTTVNVLAKVLKERGVEQVDVWCICRA